MTTIDNGLNLSGGTYVNGHMTINGVMNISGGGYGRLEVDGDMHLQMQQYGGNSSTRVNLRQFLSDLQDRINKLSLQVINLEVENNKLKEISVVTTERSIEI